MKLSAKMPAQMDSTLPAKMDDSMPSDTQKTGGGLPNNPIVPVITKSPQNDPQWVNLQEKGPDWETADKKIGEAWEVTDREEGETNG